MRRLLAAGAAAATAAVAGFALRGTVAGGAAPRQSRAGGARLPDVPLVTHEGRRVRFYSDLVRGRVVFLNMMYAQCNDRCPPMTQSLLQVQQALGPRVGRDIFMYSISLLPEVDRPVDLQVYMALHRVGPGWTFLTGARDDVEELRFALGFYDPDPRADADLGQHIGMVRIGNDALDRWCMSPILVEPALVLEGLMAVDPVSRARGRPLPMPA